MPDPKTGKFLPGESGNKTGRPKGIKRLAKDACKKYNINPWEYMAWCIDLDIKTKKPSKIGYDAAKTLIEYQVGKPIQFSENTNVDFSDREIKITFLPSKVEQ